MKTLKYAIRHLFRDPFYSFLHILGFSLGTGCAILIFLYLQDELSYDQHNSKADRVYRVASSFKSPTSTVKFTVSSPSLGPRLIEEFPEIEAYARINTQMPEILVQHEDVRHYENNLVWGDQSLFELFDYDFVYGSQENSLTEPYSIVLSEKLAQKYFGDENPVGKILLLENEYSIEITGVFKDLPSTVHIPLEGILSYELYATFMDPMSQPFFEIFDLTFVLLPEGYEFDQFWAKWDTFYKKYAEEDSKSYNQEFIPVFTRLSDLHYNTENLRGEYPVANRTYHLLFGSLGLFILLLSSINYINMTTARATERVKEVQIKRACGSSNGLLVLQFLTESFLVVFLSIVLAIIGVEFVLTFTSFNQLTGLSLAINIWDNKTLVFGLLITLVLLVLIAGLFPALHNIGQNPSKTLSSRQSSGSGKSIRNVLVIIQFSISIVVINLMLLMNRQIDYITTLDLGFNKSGILSIDVRDTIVSNRMDVIKKEFLQQSDITAVSSAYNIPGNYATGLYKIEKDDGFRDINYHVYVVHFGYIETMGLEIVTGRDFDQDLSSDIESAVLVNEALVRDMGWKDPIGKQVLQHVNFKGTVVGVVKDFNFQSVHEPVQPLIIRMTKANSGNLLIKYNTEKTEEVMSYLKAKWAEINPNRPLIYEFINEKLDKMYRTDMAQIKLIHIFSFISVFISCLGLLGLTSFTATRKTKEVGIRKVLGASVSEILYQMFKSILILITVSFVIATFASSFFIDQWLENFAYKTGVPLWIYLLTGLVTILLALFTVFYHFVKVANRNPVEALRYE